jgi:hypothetical protein
MGHMLPLQHAVIIAMNAMACDMISFCHYSRRAIHKLHAAKNVTPSERYENCNFFSIGHMLLLQVTNFIAIYLMWKSKT